VTRAVSGPMSAITCAPSISTAVRQTPLTARLAPGASAGARRSRCAGGSRPPRPSLPRACPVASTIPVNIELHPGVGAQRARPCVASVRRSHLAVPKTARPSAPAPGATVTCTVSTRPASSSARCSDGAALDQHRRHVERQTARESPARSSPPAGEGGARVASARGPARARATSVVGRRQYYDRPRRCVENRRAAAACAGGGRTPRASAAARGPCPAPSAADRRPARCPEPTATASTAARSRCVRRASGRADRGAHARPCRDPAVGAHRHLENHRRPAGSAP
jgi:hypothetical protein